MTLNLPWMTMNCYKPEKLCLLCSYRTIVELKQFGKTKSGILNTRTFQRTNHGLACTKCHQYICIDCINLVVPLMAKDKHLFVNTQFVDALEDVSGKQPSRIKTPQGFIGHCCLLKDVIVPTNQFVSKNVSSLSSIPKHSTLSGSIYFPEFDLFIDSPFDCMDIHAVGAEYNMINSPVKKRKKTKFGSQEIRKGRISSCKMARCCSTPFCPRTFFRISISEWSYPK